MDDNKKAYWMKRAFDKVNQSYYAAAFNQAIQYLKLSGQWDESVLENFMGVTVGYSLLAKFFEENKNGYTPKKRPLPDFKPAEKPTQ